MGVAFLLFLPFTGTGRTAPRCSRWSLILLVFTLAELLLSPVGLSLADEAGAGRRSAPRWSR